jgi:hypothetical protein
MEPSLAKACALIMAFCGFRPVEIRRTEKWMVTFGDEPQVIRNTAKGGLLTTVPLTPEAVAGVADVRRPRGLAGGSERPQSRLACRYGTSRV